MPKSINSHINELLILLLQAKTENGQFKDHETIKLDASFNVQKRESVDSFIHLLIEGQNTKVLKSEKDIDPKTALKLDFESRSRIVSK